MATRTVVCPECESPLSPGRFSCSACGALAASVATVARSFNEPAVSDPVEPEAEVAPTPRSVAAVISADDGWDEVPDELDLPEGASVGAAEARGVTDDLVDASGGHDPIATETVEPVEPAAAESIAPTETVEPVEPAWPDHPAWPLPTVDPRTPPAVLGLAGGPEDEPQPAIAGAAGATTPGDPPPASVPAGVYLPPSAVLPPGEALPLPGAAAAAGVQGSAVADTGRPGMPRSTGGPLAGLADALNGLTVPAGAGSRTIAIGGGIAGLGFILPWANIVIGSRSLDGGLLSTWGLAGPAAPFVLLLVLGLTALAVLRPNLPDWIGLSTPAVALAALLVGVLWPYLFGSFGAAIGVYVVAAGAFVLLAGGLLDRVTPRHEDPPAGV